MAQVDAFSKEVLSGNQDKRVIVVSTLVDNPATFFPLDAIVYDRTTRAFYVVASGGYILASSGVLQVSAFGDLDPVAEDGTLAFVLSTSRFYVYDSGTETWSGHFLAAAQTDSTASDVTTLVTDFNALLAKLRAAGLMAT
jgi:hypothetical protein